jgi:PIN domain nuclease of toxin-antitoxin system
VQNGLRVLAIEWPHAAAVERLPLHHRDPFDRLIVTQAQSDRLTIVTKDAVFRKYGVSVVW